MADSRQVVEDYSYDSDSADTVILKDDETFDQCNRAISFFRFMSVEGGQTTDGGLITASESKAPSKPSISPLPSGLSFLTNNPAFLNSTVPPGSFMFTDCRIQMALDEQKSRETSGSTTTFTNSVATKSESNSCSPLVPIDIVPKPVSAPPCEPAPNNIPIHSENGDANSQFKHPNSMQKSDLRCKNREAARKCRAKKKNYIQQLEHDFKTLKEKYAVLQQENDDLKRFIFQHFGVGLAPKPGSKDVSTVPGVTIQPAASAPAVGSSVPVVLNSASGVQVVPVTGAPVIFKVIQPTTNSSSDNPA